MPQADSYSRFATVTCFGVVVILLASCTGTGQPENVAPSVSVRDADGVEIVENHRPVADVSSQVEPVPFLEVGLPEGAAEYMFSAVGDALETSDNHLVIVDRNTREIRVYDSAGEHVRTFGGRGGGPGEFAAAPTISFDPPDTLAAWDRRSRRMTWFNLASGEIITDAALRWASGARTQVHYDGIVTWLETGTTPTGDGTFPISASLGITTARSEDIHRIRDLPPNLLTVVGSAFTSAILHPVPHWALRGGIPEVVVANGSEGEWLLSVYDLEGTLRSTILADIPRRPVTDEVVSEARTYLLSRGSSAQPDWQAAVEQIPVPEERLPAISSLLVDAVGNLWVQRWRGIWEVDGTDIYDVVDPSGRWLGSVEVSRGFGQLLSVSDDSALFEWEDPQGHPRVRVHRLRQGQQP